MRQVSPAEKNSYSAYAGISAFRSADLHETRRDLAIEYRPCHLDFPTLELLPALRRLYVARGNDAAGLKAAKGLRERAAHIDVRELIPVHADFNLDLCRLGTDGMRSLLAHQLAPSDRGRFLP